MATLSATCSLSASAAVTLPASASLAAQLTLAADWATKGIAELGDGLVLRARATVIAPAAPLTTYSTNGVRISRP